METVETLEVSEAVVAALAAGRKVDAIKLVRAEHGLGLKEAKMLVDRMEVPASSYQRVKAPHREDSSTARFLVIVAALGILAAAYYFF